MKIIIFTCFNTLWVKKVSDKAGCINGNILRSAYVVDRHLLKSSYKGEVREIWPRSNPDIAHMGILLNRLKFILGIMSISKAIGLRYGKRSLMSWVIVIPRGPCPSFFWYDTDFLVVFFYYFFFILFFFFWNFFSKSVSYQKKDGWQRLRTLGTFSRNTAQLWF